MVRNVAGIRRVSSRLRRMQRRIGLVPTMGALHEGHLALIQAARKRAEVVVVSIFVNPVQFGPNEDFHQYPRDPQGDRLKCKRAGADILFMPAPSQMYSKGHCTFVITKGLTDVLCGPFRPGHFQGVTTVVAQLFNIVRPHVAFFGQKDYQQARIIQQMVKDLHQDVRIITVPTVREEDGLAMSSRNAYLTAEERKAARGLYQSLLLGREMIRAGETDVSSIRSQMETSLQKEALIRMEYLSICDPQTLQETKRVRGKTLIALAVWIGKTRLIDNLIAGPP